jgi:DNA mismatch endonuclease (patch repair protein)
VSTHTPSPERRRNMQAIRSRDTKPELTVRRLAHQLGYRYRLHAADLPGKPDLVFRPRRKVIFVHGCFWHQHEAADCKGAHSPRSNESYWHPKLARNVARDAKHAAALAAGGWNVLIIWECETKDSAKLTRRLCRFLGKKGKPA